MKIFKTTLFAICLFPTLVLADVPQWGVLQDESTLHFISRENSRDVENRALEFTADIRFSPDNLGESTVKTKIPVASFQRDDVEALMTLQEAKFFDAENFSHITFTADKFESLGDDNYIAHGQLTIKDITLPHDLPFHLEISDNHAHMTSESTVLRLPFKVGTDSWSDTDFIANEVIIKIDLHAEKLED